MSMYDEQSWKVYGFICRYVKIVGWVGGSEPILTLLEFRNPYGKMDRPLRKNSTFSHPLCSPRAPTSQNRSLALPAVTSFFFLIFKIRPLLRKIWPKNRSKVILASIFKIAHLRVNVPENQNLENLKRNRFSSN